MSLELPQRPSSAALDKTDLPNRPSYSKLDRLHACNNVAYDQAQIYVLRQMYIQQIKNDPYTHLNHLASQYHRTYETAEKQKAQRSYLVTVNLPKDYEMLMSVEQTRQRADKFCQRHCFLKSSYSFEVGDRGHPHVHIAVYLQYGFGYKFLLKQAIKTFAKFVESPTMVDVRFHNDAFDYIAKTGKFNDYSTESAKDLTRFFRKQYHLSDLYIVRKFGPEKIEKKKKDYDDSY